MSSITSTTATPPVTTPAVVTPSGNVPVTGVGTSGGSASPDPVSSSSITGNVEGKDAPSFDHGDPAGAILAAKDTNKEKFRQFCALGFVPIVALPLQINELTEGKLFHKELLGKKIPPSSAATNTMTASEAYKS